MIELGHYFYGVTLVENVKCLEKLELSSITVDVRRIWFGVLTLGRRTTVFEFWSMLLDIIDLQLYLGLDLNKIRVDLDLGKILFLKEAVFGNKQVATIPCVEITIVLQGGA